MNADVFIEFLKRLLIGATRTVFLIVDRGPLRIGRTAFYRYFPPDRIRELRKQT